LTPLKVHKTLGDAMALAAADHQIAKVAAAFATVALVLGACASASSSSPPDCAKVPVAGDVLGAPPAADGDDLADVACIRRAGAISVEMFRHWNSVAVRDEPRDAPKVVAQTTLSFLISGFWTTGEARERGIRVSDREVRRRFTQQKRANFRSEEAFRKFLADTGETVGDLEYRVRLDMLNERIVRDVTARVAPRLRANRLGAFARQFHAKWSRRTFCIASLTTPECAHVLRSV
jgi:hypothetical protein